MPRWRHLLLLSPLLTALATSPAEAQATALPRDDRPLADSLRAFSTRIAELLRNRDGAAVVALYGIRSQFVHVENGEVIPWSRLEPMMRDYLAAAKCNPIHIVGEPGVTIVDEKNAVVFVTHRVDGHEGRAAHEGVWTGVLHRFPDGWKIVHSHSSDR